MSDGEFVTSIFHLPFQIIALPLFILNRVKYISLRHMPFTIKLFFHSMYFLENTPFLLETSIWLTVFLSLSPLSKSSVGQNLLEPQMDKYSCLLDMSRTSAPVYWKLNFTNTPESARTLPHTHVFSPLWNSYHGVPLLIMSKSLLSDYSSHR